jgi:hypothetical protein
MDGEWGRPVGGLGEDLGYLDEVGESDRPPVGPRRPHTDCVDEPFDVVQLLPVSSSRPNPAGDGWARS